MRCFEKDSGWASCNHTCSRHHNNERVPWSCNILGAWKPPNCSWDGESCLQTKCCKRAGTRCYEKDQYWASCQLRCDASDWNCNVLGRSQHQRAVPPAEPGAILAGTSLFCFVVVTPGTYEVELVKSLNERKVGAYSCDEHATYDGEPADVMDEANGNQLLLNTEIFHKVWRSIKADGRYRNHDWTVKADLDSVFFPNRLRKHLRDLRPPPTTPIYLRNIDFKFEFLGALEVLSKKAVDVYLTHQAECIKHIGTRGGEDYFTKACLDAVGSVGYMVDHTLLRDFKLRKHWNPRDVEPCADQVPVAFHSFKGSDYWMTCFAVAERRLQLEDIVGCNFSSSEKPCAKSSSRRETGLWMTKRRRLRASHHHY